MRRPSLRPLRADEPGACRWVGGLHHVEVPRRGAHIEGWHGRLSHALAGVSCVAGELLFSEREAPTMVAIILTGSVGEMRGSKLRVQARNSIFNFLRALPVGTTARTK